MFSRQHFFCSMVADTTSGFMSRRDRLNRWTESRRSCFCPDRMVNEAEINDVNGQQMLEKKKIALWLVNQPPLTYPPRNKALLRAY